MNSKTYKIKCSSELLLYNNFLKSINWMLDPNLTDSEIEILAFIMYYNAKYSEITDKQKRFKFIFSSSTKKEIREEFDISSSKLETYLSKLRFKGALTEDNILEDVFCVDLSEGILISFHLSLKPDFKETSTATNSSVESATKTNTIETSEDTENTPPNIIDSGFNQKALEESLKFLENVKHTEKDY